MRKLAMLVAVLPAVLLSVLPAAGIAQSYPARPMRFIVPFAAGGGADILARSIGQKLTDEFGQQVVVDNRTGASSIIGTEAAAKAPADGYTMLIVGTGHVVNPSMYAKLPYDTLKDFAPITQLTSSPNVLIVHPSVPAKSVAELITLARSRTAPLTYSTAGNGTAGHLSAELFRLTGKFELTHVPYKSAPQALTDVVSGQVQMQFSNLMAALPHAKTGKVNALAVTTARRSPAMPELPTMAEAGLPGFSVDQSYGMLAPAGTPQAILDRIAKSVTGILKSPDISQRMSAEGAVLVGSSPAEYRRYIETEVRKWAEVVRAAKIKAD
jgi:tripartite-type tricarboxylate transporter receptor subunit TctC